jgi:lysophospholipase L1-like esterase
MHLFVALGDSFTEGLHDELGDHGRHRGWADRVADQLGGRYANLAVRGRLLRQVVDEQLPVAVKLVEQLPDPSTALGSFHAGGNDALRPGTDLAALLTEYEDAVARLTATGARVLLLTVIQRDRRGVARGDALSRRFEQFNDAVRRVAAAHGAVLADLAAVPVLADTRTWHADRLHLNPEGHRRVAGAVLAALELDAATAWAEPLVAVRHRGRLSRWSADAAWFVRYLVPWVWRRLRGVSSGDGVLPKTSL